MTNIEQADKALHEYTRQWRNYADKMAQRYLSYANNAAEKGNTELEQRHLARAQKWLDQLNRLEGLS
jgi:hypothetical protein